MLDRCSQQHRTGQAASGSGGQGSGTVGGKQRMAYECADSIGDAYDHAAVQLCGKQVQARRWQPVLASRKTQLRPNFARGHDA